MKQRIFVGSSKEQLPLAYAVQDCLAGDAEVTVWTQGVFESTKSALESLLAVLDRMDFGIFIFAPDDLITMRGKKVQTARDNVVFELGLFIGRLGRGRGFIIAPDGHEFHVPSDLLGTMPALYDPIRAKAEPAPALASACNQIRMIISKPSTGTISRIDGGFRLQLQPQHSIDLITGAIQDTHPDPHHGAVVLPSNTMFDDDCICDLNSALGAYFQTHFKSRIAEIPKLIGQRLLADFPGISPKTGLYPAGTTIFLDRPLHMAHRIIVVAVTEKIRGAGIRADTISLLASLKGIMRLAVDKRISELWMPVLGTGHGGLDFAVALSMIVAQLSNGILKEGYHSIRRVAIMIYDPDGRRAEHIERLAKAFPALVQR